MTKIKVSDVIVWCDMVCYIVYIDRCYKTYLMVIWIFMYLAGRNEQLKYIKDRYGTQEYKWFVILKVQSYENP